MAAPAFKGDYAATWKDLSKLVKDEAGWCCVRCGAGHSRVNGTVLTVHHFDGDKANDARWNLMALCQKCHLSVQGRVDPNIALLMPPSPWSMPYIAGFYAAGRGVPGPTYDLAAWITEYESYPKRQWPVWAPRPEVLP